MISHMIVLWIVSYIAITAVALVGAFSHHFAMGEGHPYNRILYVLSVIPVSNVVIAVLTVFSAVVVTLQWLLRMIIK